MLTERRKHTCKHIYIQKLINNYNGLEGFINLTIRRFLMLLSPTNKEIT